MLWQSINFKSTESIILSDFLERKSIRSRKIEVIEIGDIEEMKKLSQNRADMQT